MVVAFLIFEKKMNISKTLLPLVLFSILANIALAQNYTQSLISEVNDGIGISNFLAAFLLPDDYWTKALFLSRFEISLVISLVLVIIYFVLTVIENKNVN